MGGGPAGAHPPLLRRPCGDTVDAAQARDDRREVLRGFDVVLTTYHAIKSNEVTVPVDDAGRAILGSARGGGGGDGGWFTARGAGSTQPEWSASAPQKCHHVGGGGEEVIVDSKWGQRF